MTTRYPLDHPGGVESVARSLADCIGRSGGPWAVSHVAAYSGRGWIARIPLIGDLVAAGLLAVRVIGRADVLLVHGAEYAWGPLAVGRLTGRPVVTVWHGVRGNEVLPPTRRRIGKAARGLFLWSQGLLQGAALRSDATVAVSSAVARRVRSRYGFGGEIELIPNGVALQPGPPRDETQTAAIPPDRRLLRVMWVGTSPYQKGLDLAVGGCEIARAHGLDIALTVVGITTAMTVPELASAGDWITVAGSVRPAEMAEVYRQHDVLLFPSRYEAFGLVALEAQAAGVPVIGSSVVESVIEGAGEVVADQNPEAYAKALEALADPERRRQLADVGRARARTHTWESSAARYLEVLSAVDTGGRPGRG